MHCYYFGKGPKVTKAGNTEEEKQHLDSPYRVLFDYSPIAYFSLSQSGVIQQVNDAAIELLGYPESDLLKRDISSLFISDESSNDIGKILISEILQGKELKDVELQMTTADGDRTWVSITASIIEKSARSKSIGLLATNIDRRKHAEARAISERERAALVLEVMTHDLNNVNQSLIFSLGLLGESQNMDKIGLHLLTDTMMEVKRASRMILNLRTIFSLSETSIEKEWLDIHASLKAAIDYVASEFETKKLVVHSDIEEGVFITEGHELLNTVFFNILHNAMQFDESEEVQVKISAMHTKTREKIRIEFEDNGPGVPDSLKQSIFKRTGIPEKQVVGRGLGLTLADRILQVLGGVIWVEDKVEGDHTKGARFVILMPSWNEQKVLECGKSSCITFYRSNHCLFCDPTYEILVGVMDELGIPSTILESINVDDPRSHIKEEDLPMLPLIRICGTQLVGFADIEDIRVALMNLLMMTCYPY